MVPLNRKMPWGEGQKELQEMRSSESFVILSGRVVADLEPLQEYEQSSL